MAMESQWMDTMLQAIQKLSNAATPWLVGADVGLCFLWFILLIRETKPFAKEIKWFCGLAPLRKATVILVLGFFTWWWGGQILMFDTDGDGVGDGDEIAGLVYQ